MLSALPLTTWGIILVSLLFIAVEVLIFPILAFVDCIRNPGLDKPSKIAWRCFIFLTLTFGAMVHSFFGTKRPLLRTMAVVIILLIGVSFVLKAHMEKVQASAKAERKAQEQASYAEEWNRYKPIYDSFGMTEVWTLYQAGRCEEGKQILATNRETYRQTIITKERESSQHPLDASALQKAAHNILDTANKGYDMCTRIREKMKPETAPTPPAGSRSIGDALKNMKASNSLSELGQIRTSLAIYYGNTNGHYPAKLEDIIGKEGTVYDLSGPTKAKSIQSIPTLILPDHTETHEVVIYSSDVCGGTNLNKIDSTKLRDTGKWGYVADPKAECYGTAFIDCTHVNRVSGKHWYEY